MNDATERPAEARLALAAAGSPVRVAEPQAPLAGSLGTPLPSSPAAATMPSLRNSPFVRGVAGVFATRVAQFVLAFLTSIIVARLLGKDGKGIFTAVTTIPGMLAALALFGLPAATNYFAGRGHSVRSLLRASYLFTAVICGPLVAVLWFALPFLEESVLKGARTEDLLAHVMLLTFPLGTIAAFAGAILYGRRSVRAYNVIQVAQSALLLVAAVVLIGALGFGVRGAVAGSVLVSVLFAVAVVATAVRLSRADTRGTPAPMRGLLSYGARVYPASLSQYFNYRADTLILQALILAPEGPLGLYSMAVTMAEVVFYVPDSIGTLFLPKVAGSSEADANRIVGTVGRFTMLLTGAVALALVPAGFVGIHLVLPDFVDSLPAFYVLLPGVVALSTAKVMSSFVSGRGRPGPVSAVTVGALVVNVALNLVFIPRLGIVGASLASLVSYTFQAAAMLLIAARLSGRPPLSLIVPGREEFALLWTGTGRIVRRRLGRGGSAGTGR